MQCYGYHSQIIFHRHVIILEMIYLELIYYIRVLLHMWVCWSGEAMRRSLTQWYVCLCGEKTLLNFVPIMPLCATTYIDGTRSVLWKITDTSSNFSDCLPISICRPFLYKKYEYVFEICFEIVEETCYKCPKNIYMEQYSFREREREKKNPVRNSIPRF